jgi:uncharacterized membrane protein YhaH (DUF805 family)/glutaredoxin
MSNSYDLVYFGEILPGWEAARVREALAATLRLDTQQSARVFSGERIVLKRSLEAGEAERYVKRLEGLGVRVRVEPPLASLILASPPVPPPLVHAAPPVEASSPVAAAPLPLQPGQETPGPAHRPVAAVGSAVAGTPAEGEASETEESAEAEPAAWFGWRLEGRIGRLSYLWSSITLTALTVLVAVSLLLGEHWGLAIAVVLLSAAPSLRLIALRCHDIGWSGWWALLALVPYVGLIFMLVILFVPGGENIYGARPRRAGAVAVAIALIATIVCGAYVGSKAGTILLLMAETAPEPEPVEVAAAPEPPPPITVAMYGAKVCPPCEATREKLIKAGINVVYLKLDGGLPEQQRAEILAKIEKAGITVENMEMPIVEVDGAFLQNPPAEILAKHLQREGR